jgi:hypothetical protein
LPIYLSFLPFVYKEDKIYADSFTPTPNFMNLAPSADESYDELSRIAATIGAMISALI